MTDVAHSFLASTYAVIWFPTAAVALPSSAPRCGSFKIAAQPPRCRWTTGVASSLSLASMDCVMDSLLCSPASPRWPSSTEVSQLLVRPLERLAGGRANLLQLFVACRCCSNCLGASAIIHELRGTANVVGPRLAGSKSLIAHFASLHARWGFCCRRAALGGARTLARARA